MPDRDEEVSEALAPWLEQADATMRILAAGAQAGTVVLDVAHRDVEAARRFAEEHPVVTGDGTRVPVEVVGTAAESRYAREVVSTGAT